MEHAIAPVPARQWVPPLPNPLRVLPAAQPLKPVLQRVQRGVMRQLLDCARSRPTKPRAARSR